MSRLADVLAKLLLSIALLSLATIVVALAGQVVFRYALRAPLAHSDESAQTALVWLTFAGAAYLYRERRHVEINFVTNKLPARIARAVFVAIELIVVLTMAMICVQVLQTRGVMQQVVYGTLQLPKFLLHFVPLLISAGATLVFAVEAVIHDEQA